MTPEHGCTKCDAMDELSIHFEAIFNLLDKHRIDYGDLPWERIRIHNTILDSDHKDAVYELE